MSGILNNKKRLVLYFVPLVIIVVCLCLANLYLIAAIAFVFILCLYYLNEVIYGKIIKPTEKLGPKRRVGEIDMLVIGDLCSDRYIDSLSNKANRLVITAPDRSLHSSFLILSHTGSVLTPNGTVVIVAPKRERGSHLTVFDIPFVSLVTSLEEGCNKKSLKNTFPLFISPIRSIKMLIGSNRMGIESQCLDKDLLDYCKRKGFELLFVK